MPEAPNPIWLEQLPLPAGVIRDGRFTYVNAALANLVGYDTPEAMTGMEFFAPVAEEHRARVRERHARRLRGDPVTESYELDVVRIDGTRRRVEIHVAQVGRDTLFQLYDRTTAAEHETKLLALAQLGAAVQAERTRDGVLTTTEAGAAALGIATMRIEPRGSGVVITAFRRPDGRNGASLESTVGISLAGQERPWSPLTRAAWEEGVAYVDDLPILLEAFFGGDSRASDLIRRLGYRRAAFVRIEEGGAPSYLLALMAPWLQREDVPTLCLFAAQVTAALTAARTIAELSKGNDELAALNRIATSAGTITESAQLFTKGSAALAEAIGGAAISFYLLNVEEDVAVLAHHHGGGEDARYVRVPLSGTRLGEIARDNKPHVFRPSERDEPQALLERLPLHAVVSVPLVARGEVIGVMSVAFSESRPLDSRVIEFLQAAAAHFAASIETSRLVNDLRRSYEELSRTQKQLVHGERLAALGELAAAVAHEVRNPLGVIFNAVGSLRRLLGEDKGDAETLIRIVAEEAARLNDIVGDLLDFARPVKLDLQRANLTDIVRAGVDAALAAAANQHIHVDVITDAEVPAVPVDARLVRQAVINIAMNAAQSIGAEGELRIRISSVELEGHPYARVEMSDTGPGIPPEVLPRVFEPFFTTRPKGTGLGLAVVKRIMEGHRGRVAVSSTPGCATTFAIDFPADREP